MNDLRMRMAQLGARVRSGMQVYTARLQTRLRYFMAGRIGADKLSTVMLIVALVCSLFGRVGGIIGLVLCLLSYLLMAVAIFRCLSRNTAKRYQENRRFLLMIDRVKDRQNRYFICPKCNQTVRVPRHKGKIAITCPKCRERFERRT